MSNTSSDPWNVTEAMRGKTLAAIVRAHLDLSWKQAKKYVETGKVFVDGDQCAQVSFRPQVGQSVGLRMSTPRPQAGRARVEIVYEDAHVVIIDKPSGVSSVPYEKRETGTAMDLLREAWRKKRPDAGRVPIHVVHRIDKATSGLLAFAKTKRAELGISAQLRAHTVNRQYICAVQGRLAPCRIESRLVRDRGDGLRGSTRHANQGKRAVTHVDVLQDLSRAVTLCAVRLETGKTHQIRIHLSERGHPILGETVYIREFLAAERRRVESPRLLLHARTLGFEHPVTGERVQCAAPLPDDFTRVIRKLGWKPDGR